MADKLTFAMLISVVDKATAPLRSIGTAFANCAKAGKSLGQLSQVLHDARENVQDFADRGKAALQSLLAPSASVSESLAKVQTVVTPLEGTMTDALGRIKSAAIDWSKSHRDSASQFIDTTYMMISAGLDEVKAVEAVRVAMQVARATMGDSTVAANIIGGAYNTMGDKAKPAAAEIGRLGDVITKTQQTFQFADLNQLAEGLKNSTAAALQTGLSFEQLNTVIGALNSSQLQGAMAGTSLKAAMLNVQRASEEMKFQIAKTKDGSLDFIGTVRNLEQQFGSLASMSPEVQAGFRAAFGDEGWAAVSLLIGKSGELDANLKKVADSAGAAAAATAIMESTQAGGSEILANQVTALKVSIAEGLMPAISSALPHVSSIVQSLSSFAGAHPQLVAIGGTIAILAVGTAQLVAPLLSVASAAVGFGASALTAAGGIGTAVAASWAWAAALLANPITWIVAAVIAAVALIVIYWEPISEFFLKLWGHIKETFSAAWGAVKSVWGKVVAWFQGLFGGIRDAFKRSFVEGLWKLFLLLSPMGWVIKIWGALLPWFASLWPKVKGALLRGLISVGGAVVGVVTGIWQSIKDAFGKGILTGLAKLLSLFSPVAWIAKGLDALTQYLFGFSLADAAGRILASLWGGLKSAGASVYAVFDGIWQSIKDAFDRGILQGLARMFELFAPVSWIMKGFNAVTQFLFGFSLTDAAMSVVNSLLGVFASIGETLWSGISNDLQRAWEVVSSFSLLEAGANIVNSIVEGIKSAAAGPAEAMSDVVAKVRAYLPFSPAKVGPLRDLNRVKLVETVASAVHPEPLVAAMSGVAQQAFDAVRETRAPEMSTMLSSSVSNPGFATAGAGGMAAGGAGMPRVPAPAVAPITQSVMNSSSVTNVTSAPSAPISVTFNLGGGKGAVDELEQWIRDPSNARTLTGAIRAYESRERKKAF